MNTEIKTSIFKFDVKISRLLYILAKFKKGKLPIKKKFKIKNFFFIGNLSIQNQERSDSGVKTESKYLYFRI